MQNNCYKFFDFLSIFGLYGIIFFIPVSIAAIESFFGLAFLGFIGKKILRPEFKFIKSQQHLFLLCFIIFSTLSMLNSGPYLLKSFKALFFKWLEYIWIYIFAMDALNDRKRINIAVSILLFVSLFIGIAGLTQRFLGIEFIRHKSPIIMAKGMPYITSTFNHYNAFGSYLAFILLIAIALLMKYYSKICSIVFYTLISLLATCLLLTFSRGSWINFGLGLGLMAILFNKRRAYFTLFILLIIFAVVAYFFPQIKSRFVYMFQQGGDADRYIIWKGAIRMIQDNPFLGKGVGTFMDYLSKYATLNARYAHNCYLQLWAETGIFSLLGFLGFLYLLLYGGIKYFKKEKDVLFLGILCGIFGFLVHSFFDNQFYSLQQSVLFWVMAGIVSSMARSGA